MTLFKTELLLNTPTNSEQSAGPSSVPNCSSPSLSTTLFNLVQFAKAPYAIYLTDFGTTNYRKSVLKKAMQPIFFSLLPYTN